jgi:hypothetical protein
VLSVDDYAFEGRPLLDELPAIRFVEAKNYTRHVFRPVYQIKWIVLHCMESPDENLDRAERCANWMAGKNPRFPAPRASPHICVDGDSIVACVRDYRIAWHAPGANRFGYGIEHAGKAKQSRAEWLDDNGIAMFDLSAMLVEEKSLEFGVPIQWVDAAGLLDEQPGITTHFEVTRAFKKGNHTDPGKGFPIRDYIQRVIEYRDRRTEQDSLLAVAASPAAFA